MYPLEIVLHVYSFCQLESCELIRINFVCCSETRLRDFTPRLFELTGTTGEFVASEVINTARSGDTEAFPFLQSDIYSVIQPGMCVICVHISTMYLLWDTAGFDNSLPKKP